MSAIGTCGHKIEDYFIKKQNMLKDNKETTKSFTKEFEITSIPMVAYRVCCVDCDYNNMLPEFESSSKSKKKALEHVRSTGHTITISQISSTIYKPKLK